MNIVISPLYLNISSLTMEICIRHMYSIGQKVCSGFYIASYRKFQTSFLANPTYAFFFFEKYTHTHTNTIYT